MGSLKTTTDVKKAVLTRCGELTDGSSSYDQTALDYVNTAYHSILAGGTEFDVDLNESWIWAQSALPLVMSIYPALTPKVTVTKGSSAATMDSAISYSLVGNFMMVATGQTFAIYRVLAHVAGSASITLDQNFLDVSGTYQTTLVKLDYTLSQPVLRLMNPMIHYADTGGSNRDAGKIFSIDAGTMMRDYPLLRLTQGIPDRFAVVGQDVSGNLTVRMNAWPLNTMRVEVPYIPIQADLADDGISKPLIPFAFRDVLVHMAAYMLMVDKSDDRADSEAALAKAKLTSMKIQNRKQLSSAGRDFGRLIPRMGGLRKIRWF